MYLLSDQEVRADLVRLDDAWRQRETFLLLPDRTQVGDDWLRSELEQIPPALRSDHFVMLTSGSTGLPKLVIGVRQRAAALARALHGLQDSDSVRETIVALPLSYTYSFVNQWVWSTEHGRRLRPTLGFADPAALRHALHTARDAMLCLVGVHVPLLADYFGEASFPGVIRLHFAGGRFPQEKLELLQAMFPNAQVYNNYGCAEAMPRLTLRPAADADEAANIGRPLPGIEMRCAVDGALQFRSPYGAVGVVEGGRFLPIDPTDWTATGDLGEPAGEGRWRLLGRASEVFKRHGEKVSLQALTSTVASAWPGQCSFYRDRDRLGEEGCVLVLAGASAEAVGPVLLALRRRHPRAHWPLRIESLPELPLLPNGKPDVRALPVLPGRDLLWKQHL